MNRRGLLGVFAALPFGGAAFRAVAAPTPMPVNIDPLKPSTPFGWIKDIYETTGMVTDPGHTHSIYDPGHSHRWVHARNARSVKMIWDGDKFVRMDGPEGTAVLNQLLTGRRA